MVLDSLLCYNMCILDFLLRPEPVESRNRLILCCCVFVLFGIAYCNFVPTIRKTTVSRIVEMPKIGILCAIWYVFQTRFYLPPVFLHFIRIFPWIFVFYTSHILPFIHVCITYSLIRFSLFAVSFPLFLWHPYAILKSMLWFWLWFWLPEG